MNQPDRECLLKELQHLLEGGNAHVPFEEACADVPPALLNQTVPELPYTLWQLAEHIRIAQWDIVEFCINPAHVSPKWPDEYWPAPDAQGDAASWAATLTQIREEQERFLTLISDPAQDLFAALPHGTGQNLFREAVLIADHSAYHTGQIILLRRLLRNWG
ncbi:DinB family protein [Hymenobacter sp. BT491]|uniref:DinB family protein n=1 Tax=Hymenobacter sp. BT491 TaxID=2766779 RepID=UPI00165383E3|nr:DinB family protein [Hymenobacter sp. BT491]MBC6989593.1 DinB family protein [Hymenobacter sp. BT491]